ncbi:MAG TPA: hypothetical protein VMD29_11510 [Terracidiphilus sp.]|nr:hypothetical protein [Terracidiphilus sp.]
MQRTIPESEIEATEKLNASGQHEVALTSITELLKQTDDDGQRMRLLFGKVTACSFLDRPELVESTMRQFDALPDPESSRALANLDRAYAEDSLGRPQHALSILDALLQTGLFEQPSFRIHKLRLCATYARALTRLRRPEDALGWIKTAESLYPSADAANDDDQRAIYAWVMPQILLDKANCFLSLDQFDEAFQAAGIVRILGDSDEKSLALQYMAECRAWQRRPDEALRLYSELMRRLPSRLVEEDRVRQGIADCITSFERRHHSNRIV